MAGFLHSKGPGADKSVLVCPVFAGPAVFACHLGLSILLLALLCSGLPLFPWGGIFISAMAAMVFPCMVFLAYVILAHCRSIDVVQHQVRNFTVQQCSCHCCESGHVDAKGGQVMCDRLIILRCISAWFGSVETFESMVRTRLLETLVYQLANQVFPYWRIVHAASPVAWAILDLLDWNSPELPADVLLQTMLAAVNYPFCNAPSFALIMLRVAYRVRNLGHSKWTQWLLSAALVAAAVSSLAHIFQVFCDDLVLLVARKRKDDRGPIKVGSLIFVMYFFCEEALRQLSHDHFGNWLPAHLVALTFMGTVTLLLWRHLPAIEMRRDSSISWRP